MAGGGKRPGAGRKRGALNKATAEVRSLAAEHAPAALAELARLVTKAESESARIAAIGIVLDRAYGKALPGRPIHIDLPDTSTLAGVTAAVAAITRAASLGEITPGEASDLCGVLDVQRRAIELSEIETRLARLEGRA